MKCIITFFFFAFSIPTYVSAQSSVIVEYKRCKLNLEYSNDSSFSLYKNGAYLKYYRIGFKHTFQIDSLLPGNYEIEYRTVFQTKQKVPFVLEKNIEKKVILCVDYLNEDKLDYSYYIDQLEDGDSFSINLFSYGCFHMESKLVEIKKENSSYILSYLDKKKELSELEIELLREFEKELKSIPLGACTTEDNYTLKYKDEVYKKMDGTCDWEGLRFLLINLGLKK